MTHSIRWLAFRKSTALGYRPIFILLITGNALSCLKAVPDLPFLRFSVFFSPYFVCEQCVRTRVRGVKRKRRGRVLVYRYSIIHDVFGHQGYKKIDAMPPIPLGITGDKHRTHKPLNLLNFIQLQYTDAHYCPDISFAKITTKLKTAKIFPQISFQYSYREIFCKSIPPYLRTERMTFKLTSLLLFPLTILIAGSQRC